MQNRQTRSLGRVAGNSMAPQKETFSPIMPGPSIPSSPQQQRPQQPPQQPGSHYGVMPTSKDWNPRATMYGAMPVNPASLETKAAPPPQSSKPTPPPQSSKPAPPPQNAKPAPTTAATATPQTDHIHQGVSPRSFDRPAPLSPRRLTTTPKNEPSSTSSSNGPSTPGSPQQQKPQQQPPAQKASPTTPKAAAAPIRNTPSTQSTPSAPQPGTQSPPTPQPAQGTSPSPIVRTPVKRSSYVPPTVKATLIPQRAPRVKASNLGPKQTTPPVQPTQPKVQPESQAPKQQQPLQDNIIPPPPVPVADVVPEQAEAPPLNVDLSGMLHVLEAKTVTGALKGIVINDYWPIDSEDLQLTKGDIVYVLERDFSGWWKGVCNNKLGLFPGTCVQLEGSTNGPQPETQNFQLSRDTNPNQTLSYSTLTNLSLIPPGADLDYLEVIRHTSFAQLPRNTCQTMSFTTLLK